MNVIYEDMPCFDPNASDVDSGIFCGAFEQFVASETLRFTPHATSHDGMLAERRQLVTRLHEEFIDADLCLLARALLQESRIDVAVYKNQSAGLYGECPPIVQHKATKLN